MSKGRIALHMLVALIMAFALTGILIILAAWISYKTNMDDKTISFMVVFIYIFSNAVSGLYIGKCIGKRRFMWGMLAGVCYCLILFFVSLCFSGGMNNIIVDGVCTMLLCAGGGTLGGMIS